MVEPSILDRLASAIEVRRSAVESAEHEFATLFGMASRTGKARLEWCLALTDLAAVRKGVECDIEMLAEMRELYEQIDLPLANAEQVAEGVVARGVVILLARAYGVEIERGEL